MKKQDQGCKRHAKETDKQQQQAEKSSRKQCAPQQQQEDLVAREFKKLQEQGLGFAKPIA